jgi:hypothetical protein
MHNVTLSKFVATWIHTFFWLTILDIVEWKIQKLKS